MALILMLALSVAVGGSAAASGPEVGGSAVAEQAKKKKGGKGKGSKCRAKAKGKRGAARREAAKSAARKGKRRAKRKGASCRKAEGKAKRKQRTGGLADGTYEDAANGVTISIQDGATKVTVKANLTTPALYTLTLTGDLGPDGSAGGSSTSFAGVPVDWELQLSGTTSYRLQLTYQPAGPEDVISGTLR